ncbi:hypothetical protein G7Y79_00005g016160 [Physcia stellaris]|nr:hypothetical protein G7Y79_00005g016160 [Physcia stellaris]
MSTWNDKLFSMVRHRNFSLSIYKPIRLSEANQPGTHNSESRHLDKVHVNYPTFGDPSDRLRGTPSGYDAKNRACRILMQNGVWNDLAASVIFCEGRSAEGGEVLDDKDENALHVSSDDTYEYLLSTRYRENSYAAAGKTSALK